jgi:hypothetical protein
MRARPGGKIIPQKTSLDVPEVLASLAGGTPATASGE